MITKEIITLGTTLGLNFNEKDNFPHMLERNEVVFNGINGQRFRFVGEDSDNEILEGMGRALILMGERKKKMEINRALSIMSD